MKLLVKAEILVFGISRSFDAKNSFSMNLRPFKLRLTREMIFFLRIYD